MHIKDTNCSPISIENLDTITDEQFIKKLWTNRVYGTMVRKSPPCYELPFKLCRHIDPFVEQLYSQCPDGRFIISVGPGGILVSVHLND